jgi:bacteriocin-like protein
MNEVSLKELAKIIGGQSFSEVKNQMSMPVNGMACSNIAPCNALDILACTTIDSNWCNQNARLCY